MMNESSPPISHSMCLALACRKATNFCFNFVYWDFAESLVTSRSFLVDSLHILSTASNYWPTGRVWLSFLFVSFLFPFYLLAWAKTSHTLLNRRAAVWIKSPICPFFKRTTSIYSPFTMLLARACHTSPSFCCGMHSLNQSSLGLLLWNDVEFRQRRWACDFCF